MQKLTLLVPCTKVGTAAPPHSLGLSHLYGLSCKSPLELDTDMMQVAVNWTLCSTVKRHNSGYKTDFGERQAIQVSGITNSRKPWKKEWNNMPVMHMVIAVKTNLWKPASRATSALWYVYLRLHAVGNIGGLCLYSSKTKWQHSVL